MLSDDGPPDAVVLLSVEGDIDPEELARAALEAAGLLPGAYDCRIVPLDGEPAPGKGP